MSRQVFAGRLDAKQRKGRRKQTLLANAVFGFRVMLTFCVTLALVVSYGVVVASIVPYLPKQQDESLLADTEDRMNTRQAQRPQLIGNLPNRENSTASRFR